MRIDGMHMTFLLLFVSKIYPFWYELIFAMLTREYWLEKKQTPHLQTLIYVKKY